ncbi:Protein of unknown function [Methylobacterium phyllostachyos]|uniref:DUF2474 domain-containing protein n=1 Tax=Methylobacterium phyllostachyos TaxID=582672 RepID=A0A1H0CC80_9HYPH|nr:DUF2474 family protein [Methylobacterium phyllostachyos]SDN55469.1 Protein of unknown function [Methylobacterium phyllostachyos]
MAPASPLLLWKRLAWFVAIWALSIVALGLVATLLRFWLRT